MFPASGNSKLNLKVLPVVLLVLEMIRGRPSTLSGGENKVFADSLMGGDSADRTLLRVKTRERFKVKMRVVLRAVSLVWFTVVEGTC